MKEGASTAGVVIGVIILGVVVFAFFGYLAAPSISRSFSPSYSTSYRVSSSQTADSVITVTGILAVTGTCIEGFLFKGSDGHDYGYGFPNQALSPNCPGQHEASFTVKVPNFDRYAITIETSAGFCNAGTVDVRITTGNSTYAGLLPC